MKCRRIPLPALPITAGGLLAGHWLAYRLTVPLDHDRMHILDETGHAYLAYAPAAIAACIALLVAAFLGRALSGPGTATRSRRPAWILGALLPVAFLIQEAVERLLHSGHVGSELLLEPAVLIGLLVQLPLGLLAAVVARALDSLALAVGSTLRSPSRVPVRVLRLPGRPGEPDRVRIPGLARGFAERAPPLSA